MGVYYTLGQLKTISMGQVRLQPVDAGIACDTDTHMLISVMGNMTPEIARFLPKFDISTPESVAKFFTLLCGKTELGWEFAYAIKTGDSGILGFIFVNTPELNKKAINFPEWSIDFCLFKPFEKQGIMTQSIARLLYFLKTELGVKNVYTIVSRDNTNCLNMLSRLPFDLQPQVLTDPSTGEQAKLLCCPVHEINFQRR